MDELSELHPTPMKKKEKDNSLNNGMLEFVVLTNQFSQRAH